MERHDSDEKLRVACAAKLSTGWSIGPMTGVSDFPLCPPLLKYTPPAPNPRLDSTAAYDDRRTSRTSTLHALEAFQPVVDKVCDHDNSN